MSLWILSEKEQLAKFMKRHSIEWTQREEAEIKLAELEQQVQENVKRLKL